MPSTGLCLSSQNVYTDEAAMNAAGWTVSMDMKSYADSDQWQCSADDNWGFKGGHPWERVGTLSLVLEGSGPGSIEIGYCAETPGTVAIYLRGERIASLTWSEQMEISSTVSSGLVVEFDYSEGDVLKIQDEGANSVFGVKNLRTSCSNPDLCKDLTCLAISQCHMAGACNAGICSDPFAPIGTTCDDGDALTVNDVCDGNGVCIGVDLSAQPSTTPSISPTLCPTPEVETFGGNLIDVTDSSVKPNGRIYLDFQYSSIIVTEFNITMDNAKYSYSDELPHDWTEDMGMCWNSINREFTYNELQKAVEFVVQEGDVRFAVETSYEYTTQETLVFGGVTNIWGVQNTRNKDIPFKMNLPKTSSVTVAFTSNQDDLSGNFTFNSYAPTASRPTVTPTISPSRSPTVQPTSSPTISDPTLSPSSSEPSVKPTMSPSYIPTTDQPSVTPTNDPSRHPSVQPSMQPSVNPSMKPTKCPSTSPSIFPSILPTATPSYKPTTLAPSRSPLPSSEVLTTIIPYIAVETRRPGENPLIEIQYTTIIKAPWFLIEPVASGTAINGDVVFETVRQAPCTQFTDLPEFLQSEALICQEWNLKMEGDRHCNKDARQVKIAYTATEPNGQQDVLSISWELDLGSSAAFECAIDLGTFEIALQIEGSSGGNKNFDTPGEAFIDDWYYLRIGASSGAPVTSVSLDNLDIQSAGGAYLCEDCQTVPELQIGISDWNPDNFIVHMILDSSMFSGHLTVTFSFTFGVEMSATTDSTRRRLQDTEQKVEQKLTLRLQPSEGRTVSQSSPPTQADPYGIKIPTKMPTEAKFPEITQKLSPVAAESSQNWAWLWISIGGLSVILLAAYCLQKGDRWKVEGKEVPSDSSSPSVTAVCEYVREMDLPTAVSPTSAPPVE